MITSFENEGWKYVCKNEFTLIAALAQNLKPYLRTESVVDW